MKRNALSSGLSARQNTTARLNGFASSLDRQHATFSSASINSPTAQTAHVPGQRQLIPADYVGSLGGALMQEMHESVRQYDADDHHVIELAVPGISSHDIHVELKTPVLWISAQRTTSDPLTGKRVPLGLPLRRSFIVPRNCAPEPIRTECHHNILTVRLSKVKRRQVPGIAVRSGTGWLHALMQNVRQKAAALFRSLNAALFTGKNAALFRSMNNEDRAVNLPLESGGLHTTTKDKHFRPAYTT